MQTVVVSADREFRDRGDVIELMGWAPKTRPGRGSGACACLAGDTAPVSEDVLFGGCERGGECRLPRPEEHGAWARFSRARSAFTNEIWLIADTQAAIAAGRDKPRRSGVTARPSGSSSPPSSNSMTPLQSRLQPCPG